MDNICRRRNRVPSLACIYNINYYIFKTLEFFKTTVNSPPLSKLVKQMFSKAKKGYFSPLSMPFIKDLAPKLLRLFGIMKVSIFCHSFFFYFPFFAHSAHIYSTLSFPCLSFTITFSILSSGKYLPHTRQVCHLAGIFIHLQLIPSPLLS